jgi:GNAT superfamily N-acetyltransferase
VPLHASLSLRSTSEEDWPELRAFRLENARTHPISYGADEATTLAIDEAGWRMRARRGTDGGSVSFVVFDLASGRWLGVMACQTDLPDSVEPTLTGVYVTEEFRGRRWGIADVLLDAVLDWVNEHGRRLRLWVFEGSEPAHTFYARRGFTPTGRARPQPLDPPGGSEVELELVV